MSQAYDAFKQERAAALLSLDQDKILAYMRRYKIPLPAPDVFWIGIHKAREACVDLPEAARAESREWLHARGYRTLTERYK